MPARILFSLAAIACPVLLLAREEPARGCAAIGRDGESVTIADESAVVVWDAASKTQHFIRRATFRTKAADLGFLVPTPTQPALAEVGNGVFNYLEDVIRPKVV